MNHDQPQRTRLGRIVYDTVLGILAGFALGFFAWMVADRVGSGGLSAWPFTGAGLFLGVILVRAWSGRRRGGKWVHLLWIPVILFAALMTMVIIALRSWN
ncbi:MAG: hypothetical protein QY307_02120 [Acidimicrobiia bacterium]|nr:MAG: hypothetical protein QY307_02120 [Acidimicrobiia bacterium]